MFGCAGVGNMAPPDEQYRVERRGLRGLGGVEEHCCYTDAFNEFCV
jgi:hypothetical protein